MRGSHNTPSPLTGEDWDGGDEPQPSTSLPTLDTPTKQPILPILYILLVTPTTNPTATTNP